MNQIEQLIVKLCPNGVEFKNLGEIGTFTRGTGLSKSDFVDFGVGCIHYAEIHIYYGTFTTQTKSFVSPSLAKKLKKAKKRNLIIAGVSDNIEDICKAVAYLGEEEICISGDSFAYAHKENPRYIAYLFQTSNFLSFKKQYAYGAKVTRLNIEDLKNYTIPIPPLEIQ